MVNKLPGPILIEFEVSNTDFKFSETDCKLLQHSNQTIFTFNTLCRVEEGYKLHFMLDSDMEGAILTEIEVSVTSPSYTTSTLSLTANIRSYYTKEIYATASLSATNAFVLQGKKITTLTTAPTVTVAYGKTFETNGIQSFYTMSSADCYGAVGAPLCLVVNTAMFKYKLLASTKTDFVFMNIESLTLELSTKDANAVELVYIYGGSITADLGTGSRCLLDATTTNKIVCSNIGSLDITKDISIGMMFYVESIQTGIAF